MHTCMNLEGVLQFARYGDWCSVGDGFSSGCGWGKPPEGTMSSSFHYIVEFEMFAEIANATGRSADAQVCRQPGICFVAEMMCYITSLSSLSFSLLSLFLTPLSLSLSSLPFSLLSPSLSSLLSSLLSLSSLSPSSLPLFLSCHPEATRKHFFFPFSLPFILVFLYALIISRLITLVHFFFPQTYLSRAKDARDAVNKVLFHPTGLYAGGYQCDQALALTLGLPPTSADFALVERNLLADIASHNNHLDTGIVGTRYLPYVLSELGHADIALAIITQRDFPSWGYMIEQGATTLWENWQTSRYRAFGSRNHIMVRITQSSSAERRNRGSLPLVQLYSLMYTPISTFATNSVWSSVRLVFSASCWYPSPGFWLEQCAYLPRTIELHPTSEPECIHRHSPWNGNER